MVRHSELILCKEQDPALAFRFVGSKSWFPAKSIAGMTGDHVGAALAANVS